MQEKSGVITIPDMETEKSAVCDLGQSQKYWSVVQSDPILQEYLSGISPISGAEDQCHILGSRAYIFLLIFA